ncbi:peptide/nitrate transporter-like protein [Podospora conica]|nr:peptide/nitrate transporter-like protein [Schizothecium conicum]
MGNSMPPPPSPERHSSASSLNDQESTATEQTPLLRTEDPHEDFPENDAPKNFKRDDGGSLPNRQILLLCYARMMEPIAFFSIFPFVAQMVQRNGHLPESDVGFYSGLIESVFSATQVAVLIFWGRLADRVGRKPVLLCSLLGLTIGPVLFCMATSIPQMIVFRCLAGAFSGSDLTIRTMIAENSTPRTQAMAFSWFYIGGNLGLFLGPIIGGVLASPCTQYPGLFGGIEFFERHPYALPGFATGTISAIGAIIVALFLDETLPRDGVHHARHPGEQQGPARMPMRDIIKAPNVKLALSLYGHVMLLAFAFTAILPVLLYTPVSLGGLGFGPSLISLLMTAEAASQVAWLLLAFPILQRRLGSKGVLRVCGIAYPFTLAVYILLNHLLRQGTDAAIVWFWIVITVDTLIGPGVAMAFTAVQLALNDAAPSPRVLGTLNAVALTLSSAIRSVAPAATTALYAVGVRDQIFGGNLIWVVLVPLAAALGVAVEWLPEKREPRAPTDGDRDADAP